MGRVTTVFLMIVLMWMIGRTAFGAEPDSLGWSRPYGLAGCGLGSVVMGKKGNQLLAGTTNSTGLQTFAVSSGTSNCVDSPANEIATRMDGFIAGNRFAVATDVSRGGGETVNHLSALMGCRSGVGQAVGVKLQKNFRFLFPSSDAPVNEITDRIIGLIHGDPGLARSCPNAG